MEKCKKCQCDLNSGTHPVWLKGGYLALLCIDCRNAWHEWLVANHKALCERLSAGLAEIASVIAVGGDTDGLTQKLDQMENELYELGKAWAEDVQPRAK